jgi:hypothetical protein
MGTAAACHGCPTQLILDLHLSDPGIGSSALMLELCVNWLRYIGCIHDWVFFQKRPFHGIHGNMISEDV